MSDLDVHIVKLEPMHVASVRAIGESPEGDAWEKMRAWADPKGLLDDPKKHPVFGFDNPSPKRGGKEYGYELWIRVEPGTEPEGDVEVKEFGGGLYAVTRCVPKGDPHRTIPAAWRKLAAWVKSSEYECGTHQWLEEHPNPRASEEDFILDLYCPIKE